MSTRLSQSTRRPVTFLSGVFTESPAGGAAVQDFEFFTMQTNSRIVDSSIVCKRAQIGASAHSCLLRSADGTGILTYSDVTATGFQRGDAAATYENTATKRVISFRFNTFTGTMTTAARCFANVWIYRDKA